MMAPQLINELKDFADEMIFVFLQAKQCYQYCYYLHKPATEAESKYLDHSPHFGFLRHVLWRGAIIEIAKLLSAGQGDRYSIPTLLRRLAPDGHFAIAKFDTGKLANYQRFLDDNSGIITEIKAMRDCIYSHTDQPQKRDGIDGVTFKDYEKVLGFCERFIQDVQGEVFDAEICLQTTEFDSYEFDIISVLAADKQQRIDNILKGFHKK